MGTCLAIAGCLLATATIDLPVRGVRRIPIPEADFGYHTHSSRLIASRAELDEYLAWVKASDVDSGWHRKYRFVRALADTPIDFAQEVLVLIFHVEGSASVKVRLQLTTEKGGTLRATLLRHVPEDCVQVYQHHGFALAVRRDRAERVEVLKQQDVLAVPRR